jgi:hypothetical protein
LKVKRNDLDGFMNTSCEPISTSKMTCNTNITPVTEGPIAIYISKYATKKTHEDDGEEYNRVAEETRRKMMSRNHYENFNKMKRRSITDKNLLLRRRGKRRCEDCFQRPVVYQ